jgi:rSAM/selenodomain-associated transferase 1
MTKRIVVFGRPPEPGVVKTRLAVAVGPVAAARVYGVLLEHTLRQALATGLPTTLALAEPLVAPARWQPPLGVELAAQAAGDLGRRMAAAFQVQFSNGSDAVVLVGSDIPLLSTTTLRGAAAACERAPVVLGPTVDGGYYLVGQAAPGVDMFTGVPWSTSRTMDSTRACLAALGTPYEELPALRDLDTARDLEAALADAALDPCLGRELEDAVRGGIDRDGG